MEGKAFQVARNKVPSFSPGKFTPCVEIVIPVSCIPEPAAPLSLATMDDLYIRVASKDDAVPPVIVTPPLPVVPQLIPDIQKERLPVALGALQKNVPVKLSSANLGTTSVPASQLFSCPKFIDTVRALVSKDTAKKYPALSGPHEAPFCFTCNSFGKIKVSEGSTGFLTTCQPPGLVDLVKCLALLPPGDVTVEYGGIIYQNEPLVIGLHRHAIVPPIKRFCMYYGLDEKLACFDSLASTLLSLAYARAYDTGTT